MQPPSAPTDWKQRQRAPLPAPRYLEPTLGHRLRKMPPHERAAIQRLMSSMLLKKTIKRVLHEAFQAREEAAIQQYMARFVYRADRNKGYSIPQPTGAEMSFEVVMK